MRAAIAIVFLCACAQAPREGLGPNAGDPDAATQIVPTDAGSIELTDAGTAGPGDAGSAGTGDAGTTGPGDAGGAGPGDAGTPDSGLAFTPVVGADAGPISLTVAPESGSACAAWLAPPSEPEMRSVQTQYGFIWDEPISDGRGDLGLPIYTNWSGVAFLSDAGISLGGSGGWITPQPDGFLYVHASQPCMICWPFLERWPEGGNVFLGTGYDWDTNCTFASRSGGSEVFTSCVGPAADGGVATFEKYDEHLTLVSSQPGDGMDLIAVDAQGHILEADSSHQWRWLDSDGNPISAFFPKGAGPQPLIGGGFVDGSRIVPSGSASVIAAPSWLTERSSVSIVLDGRAYALGGNDCGLVIRDAEGTLCGTLDFTNCRTPPRPGFDGTVALPMDPFEYLSDQSFAVWPGLLH